MKSDPSVLLLEFNELSPPLMEQWIDEGKLPNFQRLRDESRVYVTETGSPREASEAADRLAELRVGARQAMTVHLQGATVFSGCQIFDQLLPDARLTVAGTDRRSAFFDIFYQVEGMKSGMHHLDGMLWIRAPERNHRVYPGKGSLLSIAPRS